MTIDSLYCDVSLPPMTKVHRRFEVESITAIGDTVRESMDRARMQARLTRHCSVAIGVGSRGIANLPKIVRAVVDWFRLHETRPFIFPAMGSHGGGTADGQVALLASLGVTEDSAGCPIRSDMNATPIGEYDTGVGKILTVHFDPNACKADAIFFLSRIKPHPGFVARHESGICKMLSIGCGKHIAAETCHRLGYAHFPDIMVGMAKVAIAKLPRLLGALAIVENAIHETALIESIPREQLVRRDAEVLEFARTCMADLPLRILHGLVIDFMGKNIAGPGMDPNVTGRFLTDKTSDVDVRGLAVLNLTREAHGNANGMGAADFVTQHLYEQIDFEVTYLNGLTDPATTRDVSLPPVMPSDQSAMLMALRKGNTYDDPPLFVRIRDTLSLDKLLVSPAVLEHIRDDPAYTVVEEPRLLEFDVRGNLTDQYAVWAAF